MLDDYKDELGCYVRFQITGPGGILYSQPFVTMAEGVEYDSTVYVQFDTSMFFRALADVFDATIGRTFIAVLLKRLLWNHIW